MTLRFSLSNAHTIGPIVQQTTLHYNTTHYPLQLNHLTNPWFTHNDQFEQFSSLFKQSDQ